MSLINRSIQPFAAKAFHAKEGFIEVTDRTFAGRWTVLMFYPADFTFVCPTELEDLADHEAAFQALGVDVYGVSTDTHFAHKAWHATSPAIGKVQFPLIGDPAHVLAKQFEVLVEDEGVALRGTFVMDPEGRIKLYEVHDEGIGRQAADLLRKVKAAKYVAEHPGEVCPAKWEEGAATLKPSLDLTGRL